MRYLSCSDLKLYSQFKFTKDDDIVGNEEWPRPQRHESLYLPSLQTQHITCNRVRQRWIANPRSISSLMPAVVTSSELIVMETDSSSHFQCLGIGFVQALHSLIVSRVRNITFKIQPRTNVHRSILRRFIQIVCFLDANVHGNMLNELGP